jgi:tripartite-type tricarboxylate transporter receptor subunit TctC
MARPAFSALLSTAFLAPFLAVAQAPAQPSNPLPAGTVTIVVPLAAGGPADATARVIAQKLGPLIDRTVVVENKPGAGGNIGAAHVANAKPDGLTWLYTIDTVLTVNPHLYASQGFDPANGLIPAGRFGHNLQILAVNAKKVPARTFAELLAYSKKTVINFGSAGIGSPGHVAFEYLKMRTGINGNHVPYRGANPAMTDLIAGNIEAAFITAGALLPHIESGVLRGLATSAGARVPNIPDIPTADEAGIKGFEMRVGNYVLVPAGTNPRIVDFISAHLRTIIDMPDVRSRLAELSLEPSFGGPKEAQERLAADRIRWGEVAAAVGLKRQ